MENIINLFTSPSTAQAIFILGLVVALGLALGSIRIYGIKLGVAGVLFSGILFGHFKWTIHPELLDFVREFGLVLFVYTIGMQVGPGFFSAFKRSGLTYNLMAAFVVISGAVIAVSLSFFAHIPLPAAVGLFAGATTNTPSLAAAQQALKDLPNIAPEISKLPAVAYAMAYPFGILGIILTMLLIRFVFRIMIKQEAEDFLKLHQNSNSLQVVDLRVENPNLDGIPVSKIPNAGKEGVVISRIQHQGQIQPVLSDTVVEFGDIVRAVGPKEELDELRLVVGSEAKMDTRASSPVISKRVIVTRKEMAGKSIRELDVRNRYEVTITRIHRAQFELPVHSDMELQYADTLITVGDEEDIRRFAKDVGDSPKALEHTELISVFVGIALGVLVGIWPIKFAGMPAPLKLGLAGGPLMVAILLSRIGRIGKMIWYMPISANYMLREFGISLFLACVGLRSGDQFVETLTHGSGLYWMACASLITLLPILLVGIFARMRLKMNYLTICGLISGSMTDPPALAFANQIVASDAQVISYAAVYPLVMILRVVSAQLIVMIFMH